MAEPPDIVSPAWVGDIELQAALILRKQTNARGPETLQEEILGAVCTQMSSPHSTGPRDTECLGFRGASQETFSQTLPLNRNDFIRDAV